MFLMILKASPEPNPGDVSFAFYSAYSFAFYLPRQPKPNRLTIMEEVVEWCKERFGRPDSHRRPLDAPPKRWIRADELTLFFISESDAIEFRIRWC